MMWKMRLFGTTNLLQLQEGQFSIGQNISSKTLRQILTEKIFEKPTSVGKLEKGGFSAEEMSHIHELPFKLTRRQNRSLSI